MVEGAGSPTAYMILERPTRYFGVMTKSDRMPVLIGRPVLIHHEECRARPWRDRGSPGETAIRTPGRLA